MSYEGMYQYLCKNGHQWFTDVYENDYICPYCKGEAAWMHSIDLTNGTDHDDDRTFAVTLEVNEPARVCTCHCGMRHEVTIATYKIPNGKGIVLRKWPACLIDKT